jgi:16S rRNA (guanine(527)-N(7))-methyltransferase RsmG
VVHLHGHLRGEEFRDRLLSRAKQARLTVAAPELDQLEAYYRLLSRWNRTINLTALSLDPLCDDTVDRLLIEPLAVAFHVPDSPGEWFDLGSGGGSPAIPLKIVRPLLGLTMVEARERKAAFLREVLRDLALSDSVVVNQRFETLVDRPDFSGVASLVTVRAIRLDSSLLTVSHHLLSRARGRLFLLGRREAAPQDGLSQFKSVETVELPVGSGSRLIIATV